MPKYSAIILERTKTSLHFQRWLYYKYSDGTAAFLYTIYRLIQTQLGQSQTIIQRKFGYKHEDSDSMNSVDGGKFNDSVEKCGYIYLY